MQHPIHRRTFLKYSASLAGLAAAAGCAANSRERSPASPAAASTAPSPRPKHDKILVGHRGACFYAPENTLESYRLAIQQGVDYVEQDLQVTRDGVLICSHDTTLERTTNVATLFPDRFIEQVVKGKPVKQWPIHTFTLAEIKRLDAGSFMGPQFKGVTIPTWQEAIDVIRGKAGLCPETKSPELQKSLGFDMEALVVDTLKKNALDQPRGNDATPVLLQSFSAPSLQKLRQQHHLRWPAIKLESASAKYKPGTLAAIKPFATATGPAKRNVTPELVAEAHAAGLQVIPYTFRKGEEKDFPSITDEMRHYLFDLGVDGMFTDNPDLFPRHAPAPRG